MSSWPCGSSSSKGRSLVFCCFFTLGCVPNPFPLELACFTSLNHGPKTWLETGFTASVGVGHGEGIPQLPLLPPQLWKASHYYSQPIWEYSPSAAAGKNAPLRDRLQNGTWEISTLFRLPEALTVFLLKGVAGRKQGCFRLKRPCCRGEPSADDI